MDPDLEALSDLVASPGWALFAAHVEQEWGAVGFAGKLASTLGNPAMDPALAVAQIQQATVAQKAVLSVRDWPKQRVQALKQHAVRELTGTGLSRRGPGL